MANEWLTQLLSGLGGAFTGEVAARGRIAEEQEAQRKQTEQQMERDRLKRIQALRQQPFTQETARQLLSEGEAPSNIASLGALQESFTPTAPKYSSRNVSPTGEVYYTEPATGRSIRATTPEGKPLTERVPQTAAETAANRPPSRAQIGAGLSYLDNWLNQTVTKAEAERRNKQFRTLRTRYPNAEPGEIGYYLMQGSRTIRGGMPTTTPDDDL